MDYRQVTSPCGLDCFNCPVYLANENQKLRAAIVERFRIPEEKQCARDVETRAGQSPSSV